MTIVRAHSDTWEIICETCQEAKVRERFRRNAAGHYSRECRDCQNDRHRDRRRLYMIGYRKENPDYVRASNQARDPEKSREQARTWRAEHRAQALATQAAYREQHRDELRDYQRTYRRLRLSITWDDSGDDASST